MLMSKVPMYHELRVRAPERLPTATRILMPPNPRFARQRAVMQGYFAHKKQPHLGPYSKTKPRALSWS